MKRSHNIFYYQCDGVKDKHCKGIYVVDCKSGQEAFEDHSLSRGYHKFFKRTKVIPMAQLTGALDINGKILTMESPDCTILLRQIKRFLKL